MQSLVLMSFFFWLFIVFLPHFASCLGFGVFAFRNTDLVSCILDGVDIQGIVHWHIDRHWILSPNMCIDGPYSHNETSSNNQPHHSKENEEQRMHP